MAQVLAEVASNDEVTPGMHLLWMRAPDIASVAYPGQFLMVRCGVSQDPLLRRPLSIHRIDREFVAILYHVVGKGTEMLAGYRPGSKADLLGPLGQGFSIAAGSRKLLLIGGGAGIAPLVFLADEAISQGSMVTMVIGASSSETLYPRSLLPEACRVVVATEDGSEGSKGMASDLAASLDDEVDQVFACGPVPMYRALSALKFKTQRPVQVSMEAVMACGVGACLGCTIETRKGQRQVCVDGPVLDLEDLIF